MKRWIFTIASALSLLLCVATAVLWTRSHSIGDYLRWYDQPDIIEVWSVDGLLRIAWGELTSREYPPPPGWEGSFWPFNRTVATYGGNLRTGTRFGFRYERWLRQTPDLTGDARIVTFPYWTPAVCFTIPPLLAGWSWYRTHRRRKLGLCPTCGYDLRATPDRCPECGNRSAGPACNVQAGS